MKFFCVLHKQVFYEQKRKPDTVIDCKGHIIAPGFIDLQINGAWSKQVSQING